MQTPTQRALRRHHYARLKNKRIRTHHFGRARDGWTPEQLGMAINTPCNCSCHMCGNPRRSNRSEDKTLAELKSQDSMASQFNEYFNEDDASGH